MSDLQSIIAAIDHMSRTSPAVSVGVSGFGGSGKSTLTRRLVHSIDGAARVRGDDFLDPVRSHRRSPDWDGVDRLRLRREVLEPFRAGREGEFRPYDWSTRQLGAPQAVPAARVLIVDAIGMFHPELDGAFDITIWTDLDIVTATERGKARDRSLGREHDRLWDDIWVPNELDFAARFDPRASAGMLFDAS